MSKEIEASIECPFYIKEGERFIRCEGVLGGTQCIHRFKSDAAKRQHELKLCSTLGGRNCPHYRTVSVLYERGLRA